MNLYKVTGNRKVYIDPIEETFYVASSYTSCSKMCEEEGHFSFIHKIELFRQNIKIEDMEDLQEINGRIDDLETNLKATGECNLRVSDD